MCQRRRSRVAQVKPTRIDGSGRRFIHHPLAAALDESEQREALRLRAHARGLELPEESALYLQRRFRRDLETLYELLDAIDEAALQAQRRLTVPFIRQVLGQRSPPVPE